MRAQLTKRLIQSAQPQDRPYELRDTAEAVIAGGGIKAMIRRINHQFAKRQCFRLVA